MAIAGWPGSICLESARLQRLDAALDLGRSIFRTAMSLDGSVPTTSRVDRVAVLVKRTETLPAPSTTWSLQITPSEEYTQPEPEAWPWEVVEAM